MGCDVFPKESFPANFSYEHGWVTVQNRTCPCTRAPTLVLLETVDDPDADTTCLREEDSESDDEKPSRRMTPAQNHPVCLAVSFVFLLRQNRWRDAAPHAIDAFLREHTERTPRHRRDITQRRSSPTPCAKPWPRSLQSKSHLRMMIILLLLRT